MNYRLKIVIYPESAGTSYEQELPAGVYTVSPIVKYNYHPVQWEKWSFPSLPFNLSTILGTSQVVGTEDTYTINLTEDTTLQANCEQFTTQAYVSKIL